MLDLALSVLFSSLIFVVFKLFKTYEVETIYAIIINYLVACSAGLIFYKGTIRIIEIPEKSWFWGTLVLGILFILVFNLMAITSQRLGVSVASVAAKMSLVIPVLVGVFLYKDELGAYKIIGIILALAAVYFTSVKEKSISLKSASLLLPFATFIGSGAVDAMLGYMQRDFVTPNELPLFSASVFATAAVLGILFILFKSYKKPLKVNLKNVLGGICLGIPNYFSIFFLLRALQNDTLNSASIFTINNVAIVMFSTFLGILLFKEKISLKNWGGIALAIISIVLVARF